MSITVTEKVQVDVLPGQSDAIAVIVVVPTGKAYGKVIGFAPIKYDIEGLWQLSVAVAIKLKVLVHNPKSEV